MTTMRGYRDGLFVSDELPPLRVTVDPALVYLGSFVFDLRAIARVERHVFAERDGQSVLRMLVLHFESFLRGVDDLYRYRLTEPRLLGGVLYGSGASILRVAEELAESPEGEMAHTTAFLRSKGAAIGDQHAVARYARIVGDDRRSELLIFYHEIGGEPDGIRDRAERAFTVVPQPESPR
jgi:hypothetical protein